MTKYLNVSQNLGFQVLTGRYIIIVKWTRQLDGYLGFQIPGL